MQFIETEQDQINENDGLGVSLWKIIVFVCVFDGVISVCEMKWNERMCETFTTVNFMGFVLGFPVSWQ